MGWINIAILAAGIMGMVNIIDSHLLSRRMPILSTLLLPVAIIHLIYGSALFTIFPIPEDVGVWPFGVAMASGLIRALAIIIMFYTMAREEISRIIPVVHTYPIFVAIMAVVLLDEQLVRLQWLAIIIVVIGAVMVSFRRSPDSNSAWLGKSFGFLLASSLLMAVADVTSKYALHYFSFWNIIYIQLFHF